MEGEEEEETLGEEERNRSRLDLRNAGGKKKVKASWKSSRFKCSSSFFSSIRWDCRPPACVQWCAGPNTPKTAITASSFNLSLPAIVATRTQLSSAQRSLPLIYLCALFNVICKYLPW